MKKRIFVFILLFFVSNMAWAQGMEEILGQIFQGVSDSGEYIFHPGDLVYTAENVRIYYSGSELYGSTRVLLLSMVDSGTAIILKFPNPSIIQIRNLRLKIISFDNEALRIQKLLSRL